MNTGAFVCSCAGTCDIDLEAAREGVEEVDVAASSELLCGDGLPTMEGVIEEYELDQLLMSLIGGTTERTATEATGESPGGPLPLDGVPLLGDC